MRTLEKRCTVSTASFANVAASHPQNRLVVSSFNWLTSVRHKIFGNVTTVVGDGTKILSVGTPTPKTFAQIIEEQIILADAYMSMAILTFLTQDITG